MKFKILTKGLKALAEIDIPAIEKRISYAQKNSALRGTNLAYEMISQDYDKNWHTSDSSKRRRLQKRPQSVWLGLNPIPALAVEGRVSSTPVSNRYRYVAEIPTLASRQKQSKDYERNFVTLFSHPYIYSIDGQELHNAFALTYASGHRALFVRGTSAEVEKTLQGYGKSTTSKMLSGLTEIYYPIAKTGAKIMNQAHRRVSYILPKLFIRSFKRFEGS